MTDINLNWANHPQLRKPTEPATADQLVDPWQDFGKSERDTRSIMEIHSSAGYVRPRAPDKQTSGFQKPSRKRTRKNAPRS